MWKVILSFVPWDKVLPRIVARLTELSDEWIERAIDKAIKLVVEAEKKYGDGKGEVKAREVKSRLIETFGEIRSWVLNLILEVAVATAKKKGLIN